MLSDCKVLLCNYQIITPNILLFIFFIRTNYTIRKESVAIESTLKLSIEDNFSRRRCDKANLKIYPQNNNHIWIHMLVHFDL